MDIENLGRDDGDLLDTPRRLAFHPLAEIFPLLQPAPFQDLVADIREHGLSEPITLLGEVILDGRNRYLACLDAGVTPHFRPYEGNNPTAFVVSLNLRRRHLDESQRADVAAALANMRQGERTDLEPSANLQKVSVAEAARMLNVSERSVSTAKEVRADGVPGLVSAVQSGDLSVSLASEVARLPRSKQREILGAAEAAVAFGAETSQAGAVRNLLVQRFTGETEWHTPIDLLEAAREVLSDFDLDPASNRTAQQAVRAHRYFTKDNDGLAQPWAGRVWLNPPYATGLIDRFIAKLVGHVQAGDVTEAIVLVHANTDTRWFHLAAEAASLICLPRGRVRFVRPDGEPAEAPTNGSALLYYGHNTEAFARVFSRLGLVLRMPSTLIPVQR